MASQRADPSHPRQPLASQPDVGAQMVFVPTPALPHGPPLQAMASPDSAQTLCWNIRLFASHFCWEIRSQTINHFFFFLPQTCSSPSLPVSAHGPRPSGCCCQIPWCHLRLCPSSHRRLLPTSPQGGSFSLTRRGRLWWTPLPPVTWIAAAGSCGHLKSIRGLSSRQ